MEKTKNSSENVLVMYLMHCLSMKRAAKIKLNMFLTFSAQIKVVIRIVALKEELRTNFLKMTRLNKNV